MRFAILLQTVFVTALPFVVLALLRRRFRLTLGLVGAGALTFLGSQLVHLPLNSLLGKVGWLGGGPARLLTNSLVVGMTAGLCEEVARYVVLRFWRRDARSGPQGLTFGVGHAGIEAIGLVGLAGAIALFQIAIVDRNGVENLGLLPEQSATLARQLRTFESTPLWVPALTVLERVCSMAFHLAATLVVLVAVVRRRPLLLVVAIVSHAVADAVVVYSMGRFGIVAMNLSLVALLPAEYLVIAWAFRALPSHDEVVPPRLRPESSGDPIQLIAAEKRFGETVHALRGSSFTLRPGERACLLGPNGAGKTTTIRLLTGALAPSTGFAFLYGSAADEPGFLAAKRRVGIVPQQPGMYKEMTCRQYLAFVEELYGVHSSDEVVNRLEFGPMLDRTMATLSGGWQRRLCLAAALIPKPELLILDEPSAGLDPVAAREVIDLLREITKTTTTLLCTHNLAEAEELCDTVIILRNGKVAVHEAIDDLRARTTPRVSLRVTGVVDELLAALRARGHAPIQEQDSVEVSLPDAERAVPGLLRDLLQAGLSICECRIVRPSLEDLFLDIVHQSPVSQPVGSRA